jgi:hypothetical protein
VDLRDGIRCTGPATRVFSSNVFSQQTLNEWSALDDMEADISIPKHVLFTGFEG